MSVGTGVYRGTSLTALLSHCVGGTAIWDLMTLLHLCFTVTLFYVFLHGVGAGPSNAHGDYSLHCFCVLMMTLPSESFRCFGLSALIHATVRS